jgi:cellulose synthase/poly-beta-1,6-N-acetylglucosamine synthase-like glycosyltransferase
MPVRPEISVVITTHNEAAHIAATLEALRQQSGLSRAEVVLVDDRSLDGTAAVAEATGLPGLVVFHAAPDPTSALTTRQQALDLGFRKARGAVIMTLDADSRLPEGWLNAMTAPILGGRADAMAGPVGFLPARGQIGGWQSCDAAWYFAVSHIMTRLGLAGGVFFGNFAFRSDLYAKVGGFDAIGLALTEDLAFARALQAAEARLVYGDGRQLVEVRAAASAAALVERTLRVTRGRVSALSVVLTIWPLGLLLALVATLAGLPGAASWLLLRYGIGLFLVILTVQRNGNPHSVRYAPFYEPLVLVLAAAALLRRLGRRGIVWGGRHYD